jgi:hypothetical protein
MLDMSENPDWADSPQTYLDGVYAALRRHSTYGGMPHSRKSGALGKFCGR